jgi:NADPH:quinone reductase-like Zn-dependent oxidoreductase
VFGLHTDIYGAHAEYIAVPESGSITTMPEGITYAEAAAICEGPWLALTFLEAVKIGKGHQAIVNGASGSIGSSAVQLAKYFGAEVTAVIGTKNVELAHSLGADRVIDYMKEDFTAVLEEGAYDFVFDAVGKRSFGECKKLLKPGGVYISTELGPYSQNPFLALWTPFFSSKKVKFPIPKDRKRHIVFFKELYEAGKLRAVIDRHYSLDEIVEAHRYAESGQKTGSVVIDVA